MISGSKSRVTPRSVLTGLQPSSAKMGTNTPAAAMKPSYGVFVFLSPGRTGLMPNEETDTAYGTDLKQAFPVGSEIEVVILDVDPESHRIRLSRKAIREVEENNDARAYSKRQSEGQEASFGSMADKVRAAFRPADE